MRTTASTSASTSWHNQSARHPYRRQQRELAQKIAKLKSLNDIFARSSVGDFSQNVAMPAHDDELTELYVGVQIMLDVIREKIAAFELIKKQLEREVAAKNRLVKKLRDEQSNLRASQSKDEAILSSIGEGIVVTNQRGLIIKINNAAQQMLGMSADQVVGKTFGRVIIMSDAQGQPVTTAARPIYQALHAGRKVTNTETLYYQRADKSRFPVVITATPLRERQTITGAILVFRDVSREKKIDQAKNEFVSLASHQLRTPLTVIHWYMEQLLQAKIGPLNTKQRQYTQEVFLASKRMAALVQALLNVSRLELGAFAVTPELVDINQIAHSVVKEYMPQSLELGVDIVERYAPHMPKVIIDPKVLYIVLQNLIGNAVKYTPAGGKIIVKIALQRGGKAARQEPTNLVLSVADNGLGIPPAQQSEIFKKLFRADNVKELFTDGNGLGLYITKSILEVAGGEIWFESKEGKGSTFFVLLPFHRPRLLSVKQTSESTVSRPVATTVTTKVAGVRRGQPR